MANQQLVDYIKGQVAAGVSRLDLEKAVAAAGWAPADSAAAFAVVEGRAPAAPVVPQAPVAPAAPVAAQPVAPVQPQPMRPATSQVNVVQSAPRSRAWLWALLTLVVLAVAAVAAYYFVPAVRTVVGFYIGSTPAAEPVTPEPDTTQIYVPVPEASTTTPAQGDTPTSTVTNTTFH